MAKEVKLKRDLGLFQVTVAGVGVILGAGIYALLGVASASAGNAVWLSFLIGAIVAIITGASYAELSSIFKGDAGEYDYVKSAINKKFAFVIAMFIIFGTVVSSAAVSLGFARYLTSLVSINIVLAAILLILLMALINLIGIKQTSIFNAFSAFVEFMGLIIIIVIGFTKFGSVNYLEMPLGLGGVFSSAALVFFAYLGFEGIIKLREETKNAERTIPKGMLYAILISSVVYVLVAISAVSIVGWEALSQSTAPMALVASTILGGYAFTVLAIIALFSTANTVLLTMVAASRQIYGMAKEHSLPKILSHVNTKTRTPLVAILITTVIAILFTVIGDISIVANITNFFLFLTFLAVNLSLIILRYKLPDTHRPFKCPFNIGKFSITASLGIITSLGMLVFVVMNLI